MKYLRNGNGKDRINSYSIFLLYSEYSKKAIKFVINNFESSLPYLST